MIAAPIENSAALSPCFLGAKALASVTEYVHHLKTDAPCSSAPDL